MQVKFSSGFSLGFLNVILVAYDDPYELFDDPSASTPSSSGNSSRGSPLSEGMPGLDNGVKLI
jgi:hypothetical protein